MTIILALTMITLGALAAQHAQTAQGEASYGLAAELNVDHQQLASGGAAWSKPAGEVIVVGLATGCIALVASCALGLAMRLGRAWRADLYSRLVSVAKPRREVLVGPTLTMLTTARPSLVALSISRT
ncbi:hypothetical protein ABIB15_001497 [Marisediminicola sp. UYEF4]|uniref:hypothetical protein n=1 Tax=Marisediminicola sp. UYEF4 TaxID=1756384 RepID=UPI00339159B3